MKITFEGKTFNDLIDEMRSVIAASHEYRKIAEAQGPGPAKVIPAVIPTTTTPTVGKLPGNSPISPARVKPERTEKQKANDERLRAAAQAKVAAKKAVKAPPILPEPAPVPPPASAESLGLEPNEVVKLRQQTLDDLQAAYANGFQKEVFELLSRFGNGAKSFRELPADAFVPIREAIDNGALT